MCKFQEIASKMIRLPFLLPLILFPGTHGRDDRHADNHTVEGGSAVRGGNLTRKYRTRLVFLNLSLSYDSVRLVCHHVLVLLLLLLLLLLYVAQLNADTPEDVMVKVTHIHAAPHVLCSTAVVICQSCAVTLEL